MQIAPLSAMGLTNQSLTPNTTYNSAQAAAESSQFAAMLKDLKEKAAGATSANHIVNEAVSSKQDKALKDACKGFEGMFLSMMYKQMRATVPKDTLFGESNAQNIFKDMRDNELMKTVAESGGVGLADMMYRQLSPQIKLQEQARQQGMLKAQEAAAQIHRK